jgi:hypothetical protein
VAWVVGKGALRLVQVVNRSPDACGRGNSAGWDCQEAEGGGGRVGRAEKFVNRACEMFLTRLNNA